MRLWGLITLTLMFSAASALAEWPETLEGHGGPVRGIAIDGSRALSASFDYSLILWRLEGDRGTVEARLIGHDAAVNDAAFAPGRDLAVSASDDGSVIIWDLEKEEPVKRFGGGPDKVLDVAVSPDGRLAASAGWDRTARVYDLERFEEIAVLKGNRGQVNSVAFSSDGETLVTGAYDGTIRRYDIATERLTRMIRKHGWGVNVVEMLPGDTHLLFGGLDGTAGVVHIETGDEIVLFPQRDGPILSAAIDVENGYAAIGGGDGHIQIVNMAGWQVEEDHSSAYGPVWGLAFADDGRRIYHVGLDDFAIGWQIDPRKPFENIESKFPRRFQVSTDMGPGERQFARKCSVCHTLTPDDANRAGPTLHGVFGRRVGTLDGYPFSPALAEATFLWDERMIARLFREGPDIVTPGTKMPIQRIKDEEELMALVAYLKVATAPEAVEGETKQ